jgi:hypothetical protein
MKLTLMIEGSASALATILAALPQDGSVSAAMGHNTVTPPPMPFPAAGDDDEGPANAAPPAVDSAGLPWDARIHSDKKGTKEDGTWRLRRGVDKALVPVVEAELRARVGAPAPAPAMVPPPAATPQPMPLPNAPMAPAAPVSMAPAPAPAAQPMPAAPVMVPPPQMVPPPAAVPPMPANPEPAPVAAPAPTEGLDFAGVMQHLAPKFNERDAAGQPVVSAEFLAGLAAQIGGQYGVQLTSITDLSLPQNAHMIPYLITLLQHYGKW